MKKIVILFSFLFLCNISTAKPLQLDHVNIELISNYKTISPETQTIYLGIKFVMEEGWHIYYKNPGIAGLPPQAKWDFANSFDSALKDSFIWPIPKSFTAAGMKSYGYEKEAILIVPITIKKPLKAGESIDIKANINWLLCKDVCIPQNAQLKFTFEVSEKSEKSKWFEYFIENQNKIKKSENFNTGISNNNLYIELKSDNLKKTEFIPSFKNMINESSKQKLRKSKDKKLYLEIPLSKKFNNNLEGILTYTNSHGKKNAFLIKTESLSQIKLDLLDEKIENKKNENKKQDSSSALSFILFSALIGGLILNVMPCVFPVLSLKIFSFIEQSGEDKAKIRVHGLVFTLGVLISFWVLVAVMLFFRSAGEDIGWGFQLQEPGFVIGLAIFFFVFALNLFGVFEIGTSMTRLGGLGQKSSGLASSFVTGVLATLAATPCSAPFLATALGATLTLPSFKVFIVFTFIAIGMSLPYLILSFFPALLKFLPRPGAWMEAFKIIMGFLLVATVAWLVKVLGKLTDVDEVFIFLISLTLIAIALWILGRWSIPGKSMRTQWIARVFVLIFLFFSGYIFTLEKSKSWEPFSAEKVTEYQKKGIPVFIDFTAEWCVTCQTNKLTVLKTDEILKEFTKHNVKTMIADWTKRDDRISKELAKYNRNAVPFYLLYTGKPDEEPLILPELLTKSIMKDYLSKIRK